ncbi:phosphatidate cytidylyltransferase [Sediminimonas qiaohouensis]|uniref:phosphatidate cytidylyltransferase n=1 Tax=Sediminimonas qiaohouensis TaxID=552061 RepID=UPI0003F4BA1D|nr:phosphatidate cytidylyltransferase [Sediminimonas qiaohouensis]
MSTRASWDDLAPRVASGAAMVAIGGLALWWGGLVFHAMIAVVTALMLWELMRMCAPTPASASIQIAILGGVVLMASAFVSGFFTLPAIAAVVLVGAGQAGAGRRAIWLGYAAMILLAGLGMIMLRLQAGPLWMGWLIGVVVVTDIAGYFAGKALGGPRVWPRVSPKKTWSGTLAGWAAAAVLGAGLAVWAGNAAGIGALTALSVLLSAASQAGDIAESAIKRRAGVKDSSALIPGHGGFLDRFDGMIGAALIVLLIGVVAGFPPGVS